MRKQGVTKLDLPQEMLHSKREFYRILVSQLLGVWERGLSRDNEAYLSTDPCGASQAACVRSLGRCQENCGPGSPLKARVPQELTGGEDICGDCVLEIQGKSQG